MWTIDGGELLDVLRRHERTLRSLRLRHVSLRRHPTSASIGWRPVLQFIRLQLRPKTPPNWVSLRGIDYEDDAHVPNLPPHISDEDSDIDDLSDETWSQSEDDNDDSDGSSSDAGTVTAEQHEDGMCESTDESEESQESHESHRSHDSLNETDAEDTPRLDCNCDDGEMGWNDLDDNGVSITRAQYVYSLEQFFMISLSLQSFHP